jgi:hypothetical protein
MAVNIGIFSEPVRTILQKYASHGPPLTREGDGDREVAAKLAASKSGELVPNARAPEAAVSGLLLLAGCWEESHKMSQDIASREGSYWHAIAHRIEPDSANAGWWFGQVGEHPVHGELHGRAGEILERRRTPWTLGSRWEARRFIEWCEEARRAPGSELEQAALEIQRAEWELLFEWCGLPTASKP